MIVDKESQQAPEIADHEFHWLSVYKESLVPYIIKGFCNVKGEKANIVPERSSTHS